MAMFSGTIADEDSMEAKLIRRGDHAAHGGNAKADARIGFGLHGNAREASEVFEKLYEYKPADLDKQPYYLQKALDHQATIRFVERVSWADRESSEEAQVGFSAEIANMKMHYERYDRVEKDMTVENLVIIRKCETKLHILAAMIVGFDRGVEEQKAIDRATE